VNFKRDDTATNTTESDSKVGQDLISEIRDIKRKLSELQMKQKSSDQEEQSENQYRSSNIIFNNARGRNNRHQQNYQRSNYRENFNNQPSYENRPNSLNSRNSWSYPRRGGCSPRPARQETNNGNVLRNQNAYCDYHRSCDHWTSESRQPNFSNTANLPNRYGYNRWRPFSTLRTPFNRHQPSIVEMRETGNRQVNNGYLPNITQINGPEEAGQKTEQSKKIGIISLTTAQNSKTTETNSQPKIGTSNSEQTPRGADCEVCKMHACINKVEQLKIQ